MGISVLTKMVLLFRAEWYCRQHYVRKCNYSLALNITITGQSISGQGGIVDTVLPLVCEIGRKIRPANCKYRLCALLQASARARMHEEEAIADGIVVW